MMRSYISVCVEFEIKNRQEQYKREQFLRGMIQNIEPEDRSLVGSVRRLIGKIPNPFSKRA